MQGDIGAAIAIELDGIPYAPLQDFRGNILALQTSSHQILEQYNYTAFGEEENADYLNPWRFSSKRSDENLICFGKRFYDPSLQRWLTPDPLGSLDGPNLYAYVWNNPTNRLDELGLFSDNAYDPKPYGRGSLSELNGFKIISCDGWVHPYHPDIYVGQQVTISATLIGNANITLQFSPEDMSSFNSHLRSMFSNIDWNSSLQGKDQSSIVTLAILVNGINVQQNELFDSAANLHKELGGQCPVIGFYNRTVSVASDMARIVIESNGFDTTSIVGLRQVLCCVMDFFSTTCPNYIVFLAGHSEGGLIIYRAIEGMDPAHRLMASSHLHIRTFGSVMEIPKVFGVDTLDICSTADTAAIRAKKLLTGSSPHGCNVQMIRCISRFRHRTWWGGPDHNFTGPTYSKALKNNIENLRTTYEFVYQGNR